MSPHLRGGSAGTVESAMDLGVHKIPEAINSETKNPWTKDNWPKSTQKRTCQRLS